VIGTDKSKSILDKKSKDKKQEENEPYFKKLLENSPDIIYVYKLIPSFKCEYISPSVTKILGYYPEQFYNSANFWRKIIHTDDRVITEQINSGSFDYSKPVEIRFIHRDSNIIWFENKVIPVYDEGGRLEAIEGILHDISNRKATELYLSYLSFHDRLTDLYNRAYFEEELKRLNTKRQLPLSVIIGDINGLKLINDAFGHENGDRILKSCANVLKSSCRAEDIVARWGGDEFSMLLPRASEEIAQKIMMRIKESASKVRGEKIPLSVSLGTSTKTRSQDDISKIIKKAEDSMYSQKLRETKSIISSIISSLEKTLFDKSVKTEKHTKRIKEMAISLGKSVGLSNSEVDELSLLATIHDIGKVAILDVILNKKENLSKREWETIKRHPEIGYRIALASKQLSSIAEYILTVHEWWNGRGYPQGLKGKDIPILSRIISIVDAYEVMITGRPYKKAISKDKAILELKKFSGVQFDPYLVEKFIEFLKSSNKY
jgi:diguanylate cyclase (GGDEF)-like protein/PAS domain S-box-containing protein